MAVYMDSEASSSAKKRKKPEHVSPEIVSKPANVCGHCSKRCISKGPSSEAIQCDLCGLWVHAACEGLNKDQFRLLNQLSQSVDNVVYFCNLNQCIARHKQIIFQQISGCPTDISDTSARPWLKEYEKLSDHVLALSKKIDTLCSQNANLHASAN